MPGEALAVEFIHRATEAAVEQGVEWLTLFAFSSENWQRPAEEVGALMELFLGALRRDRRWSTRNRSRVTRIPMLAPDREASSRWSKARSVP